MLVLESLEKSEAKVEDEDLGELTCVCVCVYNELKLNSINTVSVSVLSSSGL